MATDFLREAQRGASHLETYLANNSQVAFSEAAARGDLELLQLLTRMGVDPAALDNVAFRAAAQEGHINVLQFLLPLRGVDPAALDNYAFQMAAKNGHLDVLRFLLHLPGVDPAAEDNWAFCLAAYHGHLDVLRFLLPLHGVNPAAQDNFAFCRAAYNGHIDVLRFLLPLPGVNPAAQDNFAVRAAAANRHDEVVAFLERERLLASGVMEYPKELVQLDKHMETDAALLVYQYLSASCVPVVEQENMKLARDYMTMKQAMSVHKRKRDEYELRKDFWAKHSTRHRSIPIV
jgi:ankyrin repeat protein